MKRINGHGLQNLYRFTYLVFMALVFLSSCKSNKLLLDSNNVEYIHFWFVPMINEYNPALQECEEIVFNEFRKDTIVVDREIIRQYIDIVNSLKPARRRIYDLRVSSMVIMKPVGGHRKKEVRVCIDPFGRTLVDGVLMQGNRKRIRTFLDETLYKHYTPDDWTLDEMKGVQ
jgi:hypothetical protein